MQVWKTNTAHIQNHTTVKVGRELWRSSSPTPLLKQGHLQPVSQDHDQTAFEYLQGWRLHQLPGQPVPVLGHPHNEKLFPDVRGILLCFRWCQLLLVLLLGTTEKRLALSFLQLPFSYLL